MVCYPVLIGEMAKREIKKKSIAEALGICDKTLKNKLAGRTPFTRTPHLGRSGNFWCVSKISTTGFSSSSDSEGSRPAFCLPADMLFIPNPDGSYSPLTA